MAGRMSALAGLVRRQSEAPPVGNFMPEEKPRSQGRWVIQEGRQSYPESKSERTFRDSRMMEESGNRRLSEALKPFPGPGDSMFQDTRLISSSRMFPEDLLNDDFRVTDDARLPLNSRMPLGARMPPDGRMQLNSRMPSTARLLEESRIPPDARMMEDSRMSPVPRMFGNSRMQEDLRMPPATRMHMDLDSRITLDRIRGDSRLLPDARIHEDLRMPLNARMPPDSRMSFNERMPPDSRMSLNERMPPDSRMSLNERMPLVSRMSLNERMPPDDGVLGDARMVESTRMPPDARMRGDTRMLSDARMHGNPRIPSDARMFGGSRMSGDTWLQGEARVHPDMKVQNNSSVLDNSMMYARSQGNPRNSEDDVFDYNHRPAEVDVAAREHDTWSPPKMNLSADQGQVRGAYPSEASSQQMPGVSVSSLNSGRNLDPKQSMDLLLNTVKGYGLLGRDNSSGHMPPSGHMPTFILPSSVPQNGRGKTYGNQGGIQREKSSKAFDYLKSWRLKMNMPTDSFNLERQVIAVDNEISATPNTSLYSSLQSNTNMKNTNTFSGRPTVGEIFEDRITRGDPQLESLDLESAEFQERKWKNMPNNQSSSQKRNFDSNNFGRTIPQDRNDFSQASKRSKLSPANLDYRENMASYEGRPQSRTPVCDEIADFKGQTGKSDNTPPVWNRALSPSYGRSTSPGAGRMRTFKAADPDQHAPRERSPVRSGQQGRPQGRKPARGRSPGRISRGRSPVPRGRSPVPRGRSPVPRGRSPVPRGRSPVPKGRSPVPRGRSPSPIFTGRLSSPFSRARASRSFSRGRSPNRFTRGRTSLSRERSPHPRRRSPRLSRGRSPRSHSKERTARRISRGRSPRPYSRERTARRISRGRSPGSSRRGRLPSPSCRERSAMSYPRGRSPGAYPRGRAQNPRPRSRSPGHPARGRSPVHVRQRAPLSRHRKRSPGQYGRGGSPTHYGPPGKGQRSPLLDEVSQSPREGRFASGRRKRSMSPGLQRGLSPVSLRSADHNVFPGSQRDYQHSPHLERGCSPVSLEGYPQEHFLQGDGNANGKFSEKRGISEELAARNRFAAKKGISEALATINRNKLIVNANTDGRYPEQKGITEELADITSQNEKREPTVIANENEEDDEDLRLHLLRLREQKVSQKLKKLEEESLETEIKLRTLDKEGNYRDRPSRLDYRKMSPRRDYRDKSPRRDYRDGSPSREYWDDKDVDDDEYPKRRRDWDFKPDSSPKHSQQSKSPVNNKLPVRERIRF